ncbi:family with sequence similarity 171 member B [Limanda limanda]|uniref:family with sequence similarity 171 member B n=1 Tax=Limanda limanda TaxID=27771 RepID=UPI0029C7BF5A|nr:family with sequence similarity 171 member B [Limanda limanda]
MPATDRSLPPLLLLLLLCCLEEGGGLSSSSQPGDNGDHAAVIDPTSPGAPPGPWTPSARTQEPRFALRVLVRDAVTRQPLPGASVDVYLNHTLSSSVATGPRGEVLLWVAYSPGLSLTLLGNKEGYVPSPLPWSTTKRPIFSAVTLLLLPLSQGNVWLFEDSVLITRKLPDSSSQPKVKFSKSLLTVSNKSSISTVKAYLTVPQHHLAKGCGNCTPGIIGNKSVFRSIELKAVAAVSVLLYSGDEELQVRGPIQISLPLGHSTPLRASDTVPAWAFNLKTGAWENQGLGIVKKVGVELVWTYTASHLGFWIAAPLPSSNDFGSTLEFLSHHTYLLIGILGGTLAAVIGCLSLLLCHCGGSQREPRRRRARFSKLTVVKKDQTTSTHMEEGLLFRPGDNSLASCSVQCDPSSTPRHKANFNIYVEDPGSHAAASLYHNINSDRMKGLQPSPHYINSEEVARLREKCEQNRDNINSDNFFPDKLLHIYNQAVAIIQAPELFSAQELQLPGCKSATFPRNGVEYDAHSEPASRDSYTQTLPKAPHHHSQGGGSPQQSSQDEPQPLETPPPGQGPNAGVWGRYSNLLESSVSVPGTLNEAAGMEAFSGGHGGPSDLQGISERTLLELTRGKSSSSQARAWFVSLDGKPAASVRHSIIELHGRHRPHSSNDTSLDSGVDMNEPLHSIRPSFRASSLPHHSRAGRYGEDQDLSSSESGTTATCTPEDPYLRNILDGSSGAIPNIPEERDGMDTSSAQEDSESRGTPPPRRLRKVRERAKAEKRSAKHVREGRPVTKRS